MVGQCTLKKTFVGLIQPSFSLVRKLRPQTLGLYPFLQVILTPAISISKAWGWSTSQLSISSLTVICPVKDFNEFSFFLWLCQNRQFNSETPTIHNSQRPRITGDIFYYLYFWLSVIHWNSLRILPFQVVCFIFVFCHLVLKNKLSITGTKLRKQNTQTDSKQWAKASVWGNFSLRKGWNLDKFILHG